MPSALLIALQSAPTNNPAQESTGSGLLGSLLPMILIVVVFWFVMIQPERKARKKREAMLSAVKKGDKVMTTGGLYATVASIQDDAIVLQVDEGVRLRFARSAVQAVVDENASSSDDKGK